MIERLKSFKKVSYITLIVLFLLVGLGGLVRVTESGMGCPDWPKCFGLWVPPTCECQLPDNYHEIYKDHGYPIGSNFDVVKTWIEYFNRLAGVLTGLFVMLTLYLAYRVRSIHRYIFYGSLLCFILVILEGGLGAMVVKLNLQKESVTIHYLMAIVLIACLLFAIAAMRRVEINDTFLLDKKQRNYLIAAIAITSLQLMSGVNLRGITEAITDISTFEWLQRNEPIFTMHRIYSFLVLLGCYKVWIHFRNYHFSKIALLAMWSSLVVQIITGILLNYFNFPKIAQTIHILMPAILFCSQFYILSFIIIKKEAIEVSI